MKKYKLLKDLPTFDAGDIFELRDDGCLYWDASTQSHIKPCHGKHWQPEVMAYHRKTLERFPNILRDWFEEIKPAGIIFLARSNNSVIIEYGDTKAARLAYKKLNAWDRLAEGGFNFKWFDIGDYGDVEIHAQIASCTTSHQQMMADLKLLFGGEA